MLYRVAEFFNDHPFCQAAQFFNNHPAFSNKHFVHRSAYSNKHQCLTCANSNKHRGITCANSNKHRGIIQIYSHQFRIPANRLSHHFRHVPFLGNPKSSGAKSASHAHPSGPRIAPAALRSGLFRTNRNRLRLIQKNGFRIMHFRTLLFRSEPSENPAKFGSQKLRGFQRKFTLKKQIQSADSETTFFV